MNYEVPNRLVWGYHGTSTNYASIHIQQGIPVTTYPGDWLGNGAYFWEGDSMRARHWAETRVVPKHGGNPVVLEAVIDLTACLDLTRIPDRELYADVAQAVFHEMPSHDRVAIKQTEKCREMDCLVANMILRGADKYQHSLPKYTTARGVFSEGRPVYSFGSQKIESQIRDLDHIQINVVNKVAIRWMRIHE